jgi:hypothetical protein
MSGRETCFREAIKAGIAGKRNVYSDDGRMIGSFPKLHTIRAINKSKSNTWSDKIKDVQEGKAVLVLYRWNGKPYSADGCANLFVFGIDAVREFIDELMKSDKYRYAIPVIDSGIGVQILSIGNDWHTWVLGVLCGDYPEIDEIAKNDGLSVEDFKAWFKSYDLSNFMEIIHFTKFRY